MDEELAVIREAVGKLLATPVFAASSPDLVSRLTQVHVLVQQLTAVQVALLREADGRALAAEHGATSLTAWLADLWRVHPGSASRLVKLARLTDATAPAVGEALAAGDLNVDQAQVIGPAIADLPAEHRPVGEAFLLDQAAVFGPRELGRLSDRLLQVVAPEVGEAKARQALERLEQKAYDGRTFNLYPVMGTCAVRVAGWLDREGAAIVQAALDPLTAPRTRTGLGGHGGAGNTGSDNGGDNGDSRGEDNDGASDSRGGASSNNGGGGADGTGGTGGGASGPT
ncbi:MAG TPA: DUF222 domain-containing protein, partial [Rugosimonospora sp.]|nr:DUF222 domain-containing protein [Rugosimonospora sp.]